MYGSREPADIARVTSLTGQGRSARFGGIAPSAAASVSLVGAVVALSLLASALLGVRLWPGGPGGDSGRLTLPAAPVKARAVAAPRARVRRAVAAPAARPDRTVVSHPRPAPRVTRRRPHRRAAAPAPTAAPAPPAATTPAPGNAAEATPSVTPAPAGVTKLPAVPTPVATPRTVERTVVAVRQATQPVVQVLPPAVQTPVAVVEDTLQQAAATVDHALAPVTGGLPLGR
jgi:hypothetical protein